MGIHGNKVGIKKIAAVLMIIFTLSAPVKTNAQKQDKEFDASAAQSASLVPVGKTTGIKIKTKGVVVTGFTPFTHEGGEVCPSAEAGICTGDIMTALGGTEIKDAKWLCEMLEKNGGKTVKVTLLRDGKKSSVKITPKADEKDGGYKIGAWVRDSIAGIGTVTFFDPETMTFGALGHGINDTDTGLLMPLAEGSVMDSSITGVKKGKSGTPGELTGSFDMTHDSGSLWKNSDSGIFGQAYDGAFGGGLKPVPVCPHDEVKAGPAVILANINGTEVKQYDVVITKVPASVYGNMTLKITDPELIDATGGIVQGMSGSPLLQNGRFVGAVTHVLVGDPLKGYAIFIQKMMEQANKDQPAA